MTSHILLLQQPHTLPAPGSRATQKLQSAFLFKVLFVFFELWGVSAKASAVTKMYS